MQQLDRFERKRRGFNRKTMTQERSHYPPLRINDNSQFASESRCRGSSRELYTVKSKETRHPIPPRNVLSDCPRFGPWKTIHRPYTLLRSLKQGKKKKERKKEETNDARRDLLCRDALVNNVRLPPSSRKRSFFRFDRMPLCKSFEGRGERDGKKKWFFQDFLFLEITLLHLTPISKSWRWN